MHAVERVAGSRNSGYVRCVLLIMRVDKVKPDRIIPGECLVAVDTREGVSSSGRPVRGILPEVFSRCTTLHLAAITGGGSHILWTSSPGPESA